MHFACVSAGLRKSWPRQNVCSAAIVACCYRKRQLEGTQAQMKIAISVPPVLRGQWKRVLQRWLRLDPSSILEVKRGDDLTFAAIEKAKEILSDFAPMISRAQKGSQRTWGLELDMGFKM